MKLRLANRPDHTGRSSPDRRLPRALAGEHGTGLAAHQPRPSTHLPRRAADSPAYAYRSGRSADEEVDYCIGELRDAIARGRRACRPR